MPAVVVDISGPEPPPAYVATLLRACSSALRSGECGRVELGVTPPHGELTVHVTPDDELHFALAVDGTAEHAALSRALIFRGADAVEERWRSVGIAIASLVGEQEPAPAPTTVPIRPQTTPAVPPPSPPTRRARTRNEAWRFGAGLESGSGASDAPPRLGGFLSVARALPLPPTFGLLTARYAVGHAPDALVHLEWATFGAGLGATLLREPLALRLHAAAVAQLVAANAQDDASGASSSASRWLGGGLVGLQLGWPGRGALGAVLSAEAARFSGGTAVRLNQHAVAQSPALQWDFQIGLEYRP